MRKDIQKSIFLEQKILEFNFDGDVNKSQKVYDVISQLKPYGFELYIIKYLEKFGVYLNHVGKNKNGDGGIDGYGDGIYLQCKKYHRTKDFTTPVGVTMLRDFLGAITDDHINKRGGFINKDSKPVSYFVATVNFTDTAKEFASRNNIELFDYKDIYDICSSYTLEDFEDSVTPEEKTLCFNPSYSRFTTNILLSDLTIEDYSFYYREVRKIIALRKYHSDSKSGYIFTNETLKVFSEQRICNLSSFQELKKDMSNIKEKNKLISFSRDINKAIEILQK